MVVQFSGLPHGKFVSITPLNVLVNSSPEPFHWWYNKPTSRSWLNGKFLFPGLFAKGSLLPNAEVPSDGLGGPCLVGS